MVARALIVGALAVFLAVPFAGAQETRPGPGTVPLELKRDATPPRAIVRPDAERNQAVREAERAAAEYEQQQRDESLVRQQTRPAPRRPDLGYDVSGGIQQRNLPRR